MAALCKRVTAEFCVLSRNVLTAINRNSLHPQVFAVVRSLYTQEALGVDTYVKTRERVESQFLNIADKFKTKMKEFCEESSTNMIFTEDLKNMAHIVGANPSDMDLILKMIKRYNAQNKNLRFGSFIFGPVLMRMFHHLNECDTAYKAFTDPELDGFFDQIMSFQLLIDLLYNNQKYDQILEVFEVIKEKQLQGAKYPRNVVTLVFATYYKMNTPETLQKTTELWSDLQNVGHNPMRRAATFAASLALQQNAPHIALEILSSQRNQNYVTIRNLKVWALADLGRPEDAFPLIRNVLEMDFPDRKITMSKEIFEKLKEAVEKSGKTDLALEFQQLEKRLVAGDLLDAKPMQEILNTEIQARTRDPPEGRGQFIAANFNRQGRPPRPQQFQRPGLSQMY